MFNEVSFWGDDSLNELSIGERKSKGARKADIRLRVIEMGRNICFGGKGGGGSALAPDPAIGAAAMKNVELGQNWLDFAKDQFAAGNERQAVTDALNTKVINQQLDTQDQASDWAQQDRQRTLNTFQPIEDAFVKTAQEYDTPEKQAEAAAVAKADVLSAAGQAKASGIRQMAAMGVSPDSGRFAGVTRAQDTNTALASAGAQNNARQIVRDKGLALKADAINMGKGLASSTAAAYGIGTNAGNSAVANNASGNAQFMQNGQIMGQGFGGAIGANNSAGGILNNLYGNQLSSWSAQQQANATSSAGLGKLAGGLAGGALGFSIGGPAGMMTGATTGSSMFSDERLKINIKKIGSLDNGLNLYKYEFKDEFKETLGYGTQVGVLAQEVESVIPEAVSVGEGGYKKVDYEKVVNHGL